MAYIFCLSSSSFCFSYLLDIDECLAPGICPTGVCVNTEGSFSCMACDPGFTVAPDGLSCEGTIQLVACCGFMQFAVIWNSTALMSKVPWHFNVFRVVWKLLFTWHNFGKFAVKSSELQLVWMGQIISVHFSFRFEWMWRHQAVCRRPVYQSHRLL